MTKRNKKHLDRVVSSGSCVVSIKKNPVHSDCVLAAVRSHAVRTLARKRGLYKEIVRLEYWLKRKQDVMAVLKEEMRAFSDFLNTHNPNGSPDWEEFLGLTPKEDGHLEEIKSQVLQDLEQDEERPQLNEDVVDMKLHSTKSYRMSSGDGANMQNLPKKDFISDTSEGGKRDYVKGTGLGFDLNLEP